MNTEYTDTDRNPNRPDVVANDGAHLHIANALYIWESGEFSDWAEKHGFPLTVDGKLFQDWGGDAVEMALSDFPNGPFDPRELIDA